MSNLFQTLELEAFRKGITPRTQESRDWFRKKAQQLRRVNRSGLTKEEPVTQQSTFNPGEMYMFFYDPKTKDVLPYYDKFPLVIAVDAAPKGFYGLNLHYIAPVLRAKFLDALLEVTNDNKYDEKTKFSITYSMLKKSAKYKYFKPCFKHYLTSHVKSRFAKVSAPEWEIATFLPTADWEKASSSQVYKFSKEMI
jgi:hypothetical protein